jgi:hypothetical protein
MRRGRERENPKERNQAKEKARQRGGGKGRRANEVRKEMTLRDRD